MPNQHQSAIKLFISYSRRDTAIADVLVGALEARSFEVMIDRRDLPFGELWQKELGEFIRLCDTVIWLVSPASITSKWVNWELDEVARRHKRLVPVLVEDVPRDALPRQLGEIHILPAQGAFDLGRDLDALVSVLETDRGWLKQASRLQDRAAEWLAKDRLPSLLLSRGALADAERWKDLRPVKAPAPAPEVLDLLLASRRAVTQRQRWWVTISFAVAVGAIAMAAFAYVQSIEADRQRGVALKQTQVAEEQRTEAIAQRNDAQTQRRVTDTVRQQAQATESGLLANTARAITDLPFGGDPHLAALVALEGLPDRAGGDPRQAERPLIAELRLELDRALRNQRDNAFLPHDNKVVDVAFNVDGDRIATASLDGTARLFDTRLKREIARLPHGSQAKQVRFSPNGRVMATASWGGTPFMIDAATGAVHARFEDASGLQCLAFSPDGNTVATVSDGTAILRRVPKGEEIAKLDLGDQVSAVVFSPNGRHVLVATPKTVRLIDAAKWTQTASVILDDVVSAVAYSPDSRHFAVATGDYGASKAEARVFDVQSRQPRGRLFHDGQVFAIAFSPDSRMLAAGSDDKTARILDVSKGNEIAKLGHNGPVWSVAFSPDGKLLATGSGRDDETEGEARVYSVAQLRELVRFKHDSTVHAVAFGPGGNQLAAGSGSLRASKGLLRAFEIAPADGAPEPGVFKAAFSPDGRWIATASEDGGSVKLSAATSAREVTRPLAGDKEAVAKLFFSPDSRRLVTGTWDPATRKSKVRYYDLASNKTVTVGHDASLETVVFSGDGRLAASVSTDRTIKLVDPSTGRERKSIVQPKPIQDVALSSDASRIAILTNENRVLVVATDDAFQIASYPLGGRLVHFDPTIGLMGVASSDNTLRLVDVFTGTLRARFPNRKPILIVAMSPDAKVIAIGAGDEETGKAEVRLIGIESNEERGRFSHQRPPGHDTSIGPLVFSPGGQLLAASTGGEVRVYEVASGKQIARLMHDANVYDVVFSPDAAMVLTTSQEGARRWRIPPTAQALVDTAKERAVRCLTREERDRYFLPVAPPTWCVERNLWPYQGADWQAWLQQQKRWLAGGRVENPPALPPAR